MLGQDQPLPASSLPSASASEVSMQGLMDTLARHAGKPLIFRYEGHDVLPGYHVTEVKAGTFQALDCGANYETWHETFIQLWDVPAEDDRGVMTAGKFLAIAGKVTERVPVDRNAKLTFEVSDGQSAIRLYKAAAVAVMDGVVRVSLERRPASCKPRDRWLSSQNAEQASCCAPRRTQACCN